MIKKYKKSLLIALAFILSMVIAYGIGQYLPIMLEKSQQNNLIDISTLQEDFVFTDKYDSLEKIGYATTDDNPWGGTVENIDTETIGAGILLTPETGISKEIDVPENGVLYFEYNLFEGVGQNSDGAGLNLLLSTNDGKEIVNENYNVTMMNDYAINSIDLSSYVGQTVKVTFLCSNGSNNDSTCDWVILKNAKMLGGKKETTTVEENYVKSVHYFSDEWPINFWNSEMDTLDADMKQIKDDGFNSIILVIPWREFQPTMDPITYNDYTFSKLDTIMTAAKKQNLGVFTRIGYTWDFYEDKDDIITNRYYQLMGDEKVQDAWIDYVKTMYSTLNKYDNFSGGFLTWEDFWNNIGVCDSAGGKPEEVDVARYIGYQDFVKKNYTLKEYNNEYGTSFDSYENIYVPTKEQPAMKTFYDFYDDFLNNILAKSQEVFQNLSLEVRMDWDVTYNKDGEKEYSKHENTFVCGNSDFTSTMYGIPMGFSNNGERVSYKKALEKTEYVLGNLYNAINKKKIFAEQFIFSDNTPAFSNNAQIKPNQINDYLENVSSVLLDKTWGYGIWTYKDYRANMLYNSQFALDLLGWESSNDVAVEKYQNSNVVSLSAGDYIKQNISAIRNHFNAEKYTFTCDAITDKQVRITVKVGNQQQEVEVNGNESIELQFLADDNYNIEIIADAEVKLDNIRLYSQIQSGLLYDDEGNELNCIASIRELNKQLDTSVTYEKVIEDTTNSNSSDASINNDSENIESMNTDESLKGDNAFKLENSNILPMNSDIEIMEKNDNALLEGTKDHWDAVDVLNPSVVKFNGKYYNYYSGYDGEVWRTGVAISDDGVNWKKNDTSPVLDISEQGWDSSYIAANGSAICYNDKIYYYYHGVNKDTGRASIGLAISQDGINFEKYGNEPFITSGTENTWNSVSVADPYVIEHEGKIYMYYLGENELGVQRLGVAVSEDGINWIENSLNPIMDVGVDGAFDEMGLGEPSVIYQAPYFYMLYTGRNDGSQRNIGLAISSDGVNWRKMNYQGLFALGGDNWSSQVLCDTTMLYNEDENLIDVWYGGGDVASPDENLHGKIGLFKIRTDNNITNTDIDFSKRDVDISLIKGCYPLESDGESYAWVSNTVKTVLKNNSMKEKILLSGNIDLNLLNYVDSKPFEMTIYINNNIVGKKIIDYDGDFKLFVDKGSSLNDTFELKIMTNKSLSPVQYGLSTDTRELSFKIYSIVQQ
ncbi:MAG: hypothetical protein ACERKZ_04115 [Lachnotalea sp.]